MIPKKIHYCWFGKKALPDEAKRCMASWKKYAPGFEIVEWNEENYNVDKYPYTREAYKVKKYAFVSDVARLEVVCSEGGIYLDTDVELIRNIEDLLDLDSYMGQQTVANNHVYVNSGLGFGAQKDNPIIKEMIADYSELPFINSDGTYNTLSCPARNSQILYKRGYIDSSTTQIIDGMTIFSPEYFCPMNASTGELIVTKNTYSVHYFSASWISNTQKIKKKIKKMLGPKFMALYEKTKR